MKEHKGALHEGAELASASIESVTFYKNLKNNRVIAQGGWGVKLQETLEYKCQVANSEGTVQERP